MSKLMYSLDEAADLIDLSKAMLKILVARGELRSVKVGRRRLISAAALQVGRRP